MKVDYIALSIPIFFILIAIELAYTYSKKLRYFRLNDSLANLSQGIGQQIIGVFMKTALFFCYLYIYEHWRFFTLPNTIWIWILLFFVVDFFYYWFHRKSHEINALWAAHVVHHQSEEYNLTVALRQSWFQGWFSWIFYLPVAFIGFNPIMFLTMTAFNTLYQFWIHTRTIGNMGWLEYIFNTPSHHRVHHGSNPKYIDKNHGGTLIIWDRLFGTFQKEEETVYYGITKPVNSWNPVWANFQNWADIVKLAGMMRTWKDKILVFINPPGWQPDYLGGPLYPEEIDIENYSKYDKKSNVHLTAYSFFLFLIALTVGTALLFRFPQLNMLQCYATAAFVMATLVSCGALFEQNFWLKAFEFSRILLSFLLVPLYLESSFSIIRWIFVTVQFISLAWFISISKSIKSEV